MTNRFIRRALAPWFRWRNQRRLYRVMPDEFRHLDKAIREARRQHRPVANLEAARRALMSAVLAGGV